MVTIAFLFVAGAVVVGRWTGRAFKPETVRAMQHARSANAALLPRRSTEGVEVNPWQGLAIPTSVSRGLREVRGIHRFSSIQEKAVPSLLRYTDHHILQAPIGSGKTLAVLLPLLWPNATSQPQALIVAPSDNLAQQIAEEAKWVSELASQHPAVVTLDRPAAGLSGVVLPGEVRVMTVRRLLALDPMARRQLGARLRDAYFDEADVIAAWDRAKLLSDLHGSPDTPRRDAVRFIFAGATLSRNCRDSIKGALRRMQSQKDLRLIRVTNAFEDDIGVPRDVSMVPKPRKHLTEIQARPTLQHVCCVLASRDPASVCDIDALHFALRSAQNARIRASVNTVLFILNPRRAPGLRGDASRFLRQLRHYEAKFGSTLFDEYRALDAHECPDPSGGFMYERATNSTSSLITPREGSRVAYACSVTDARGLDIPHIDAVVLMGAPGNAKEYIQLSGRAARGLRPGVAITLSSIQEARKMLAWADQHNFVLHVEPEMTCDHAVDLEVEALLQEASARLSGSAERGRARGSQSAARLLRRMHHQ